MRPLSKPDAGGGQAGYQTRGAIKRR